jgi:hypothetical protein
MKQLNTIVVLDAYGTYRQEMIPERSAAIGTCDVAVAAPAGDDAHVPLVSPPAKQVPTRFTSYLRDEGMVDPDSDVRALRIFMPMLLVFVLPSLVRASMTWMPMTSVA